MTQTIEQGNLLYHSAHGLCRVKEITKDKSSSKKNIQYALEPASGDLMKVRFVVPAEGMKTSGFHTLISLKEINKILQFWETGQYPPSVKKDSLSDESPENSTWGLAVSLSAFSREKNEIKDQRKRQQLQRSARGLVREFSYVMQLSVSETVEKIKKSLSIFSKVHPMVLAALANAVED